MKKKNNAVLGGTLEYVIDDDGELDAFLVGEYSVDQSCLAAPEVSRQKQHRYFPVFHCYCHGYAVVVILSQNYNIYFGLANRTLADEQVCFVSVLAVLAHEAWLWGMTTCVMRPLWRAINKRMNFPWNLIGDVS